MMNSIIDNTNSNFFTISTNVWKADWKPEKAESKEPDPDSILAAYKYWLWDSD